MSSRKLTLGLLGLIGIPLSLDSIGEVGVLGVPGYDRGVDAPDRGDRGGVVPRVDFLAPPPPFFSLSMATFHWSGVGRKSEGALGHSW